MPGVLIGPTTVPLLAVARPPPQPSSPAPPLAEQLTAFVLLQAKDGELPGAMVAGLLPLTVNSTVGAEGVAALTTTLVELEAPVPPAPVQVNI